MFACLAAATTSLSVASGRPYKMLSRTVQQNDVLLHQADGITQGSQFPVPHILAVNTDSPLSYIIKAGQERTSVVLPPPEGPTRATVRPASTINSPDAILPDSLHRQKGNVPVFWSPRTATTSSAATILSAGLHHFSSLENRQRWKLL